MKNSNWSDLLSWQFKKKTCLSSCLTVHSPAQYIPGNNKHGWSDSSDYHIIIMMIPLIFITSSYYYHWPSSPPTFQRVYSRAQATCQPRTQDPTWKAGFLYHDDEDNWLTIYIIVTWTDPTLPPLVTRRIKRRIRGVVAWGAVAARGAWEWSWSWWLWSWFLWHRYYDHDHIDDNEENLDMECILSLPCSRLQGSEAGLGSSPMLSPWYFG